MGCDIHCALEVKIKGTWKAQLFPNKYFGKYGDERELTVIFDVGGRNYDLFAILGNVRNGSGFAGVKTGDGFSFITDCRGVPADIDPATKEALSEEHSASWLTVKELLNFDWTQSSGHQGWVRASEFESWDRTKEWKPVPYEYCGGVDGHNVVKISENEMRVLVKKVVASYKNFNEAKEELDTTYYSHYCLLHWTELYSEAVGSFWVVTMPKLLKLANEHGAENVRLVFDFDS